MHDPMVVAFSIRRPWPQKTAFFGSKRWRYSPPFINVAGRSLYFPGLATVWHVEPHGHDALQGECKGTKHWRWHIHHWHIQFDIAQKWRRRLLTRCAWCGGRSTKTDCVNHNIGAGVERKPWWRGERGLYHGDCTSVALAHRKCLCDDPLLNHGNYGQCLLCLKFRSWRSTVTIPDRYLASLPFGSRIPDGKREWLKAEWAKVRAEREASDGE